ncbi:DUF4326 domain-containing protein [Pectobacterium versatile]|uniref:DUF4326 domain-containing protein n=1 Tax=Pectobacterium TaxID=122277 RepID=UPI0015DDA462|nr:MULTISPECIES: DUF4326 domain-containing protein [Pectobacterium]MBA0185007.1 DUF4326 domain-containing protein [Pectobacterium versatile]MBB1526568.1 DUF4326 domain-containing protein [Pectobacterium carotovorum subsp. carotovorum]MCA6967289.1 DUF4326 domain-containing protein [Pectobacterium carotovorum]MCH4989709.1 DUF4326 domain-containing protein [Pectobacterium carotovorum]
MMRVFILYHPDFASKGKFERKLSRIFSNSIDYKILYFEDHHNLIINYFNSNVLINIDKTNFTNLTPSNLTHAVIIDSANKPIFMEQYKTLSSKIPVRYIKDNITSVSNKDRNEHFDTYIGRGTLWGNPYAIGHDGDRDEVIRKFKYDFERDFLKGGPDFKKQLMTLRGQTLGCHCKPYSCHGDILAQYLNELDDEE